MVIHTRKLLLEDIKWSIMLGVMDNGPFGGYYYSCSCRKQWYKTVEKVV